MSKTFQKNSVYPLQWPPQFPYTENPERSRFKTTLHKALLKVKNAMQKFANDSGKDLENVVISSNVSLGNMSPDDPGVAVYFSWDGIESCVAVDRYDKVQDNLQAIYHVLEADRTKLRHGSLDLVRATFQGYKGMLPESGSGSKWWEILQVERSASLDEVKRAYRLMSKQNHPDLGGDSDQFQIIQNAFHQAKMTMK